MSRPRPPDVATVRDDDSGPASPTATPAYLLVLGAGEARTVPVPPDAVLVVGRDEQAVVALADEKASRRHAEIRSAAGEVTVIDLRSTNGTFVNGERVTRTHVLEHGDEIRIGGTLLTLFRPSRAAGRTEPLRDVGQVRERLAVELRRARLTGAAVGLVALAPGDRGADACARLSAAAGPAAIVGPLDDATAAALLPTADRGAAAAVARRLAAAAGPEDRWSVLARCRPEAGASGLLAELRARLARSPCDPADGPEPWDRAAPAPPDTEDVELHDPSMRKVYRLADQAARADSPVLILGETGVGKEEVARYVHRRSARRHGPLVAVNCAALPEPLVESMLFGHERGAFTGASERRTGYVEAAAGGTLFLDEIGELPPASQSKLLRFLDRRAIARVGSTTEVVVDVRIVAASKRDLAREVERGSFREDLYYRLAVVTVFVPPLRDRPMDVLPLARRFARQVAATMGRALAELPEELEQCLLEHAWPGNVRELRNAVESAVVLAGDDELAIRHLPAQLQRQAESPSPGVGLPARVAAVERDAILAALRECGGNQTHAARKLGISRRTLIYRMRKYDIRSSRTTEG
ncbi:MAG: sigma 54-interacting transcriptional regulator [Deltaproteobacteria bacterium]|nr:sigma 54-interacting transcriptional regulator [Deltaproteobacteria bacterium]